MLDAKYCVLVCVANPACLGDLPPFSQLTVLGKHVTALLVRLLSHSFCQSCIIAGTHSSEVTPPNLWSILTPVAAIMCLLTWICGALCGAAMFHCRTKPRDINISQQPGPEEEQTDCMKIPGLL